MSIVKQVKSLYLPNPAPILLDPATYHSQMADIFLTGGQGSLRQFLYEDNFSSIRAYELCPPLAAVINKKAQAYINGKTWVMDTKGKESKTAFATKIKERLKRPNPIQSWKQFEAQQYIYQQIDGFCIALPIMPAGFKDKIDASSIWNIPSHMLKRTETGKLWYQTDLSGILQKITLTYKGVETELPLDQIFIFKDFSPNINSQIFPESRIKALQMPINNIIGALESRNVLINYRGALGILSSDSDKFGYLPIKPDDKKDLQNEFRRYGLKGQQWKFIITSAAVKWQQMGIPTRDLMLFEEIADDVYMICDQFNYPSDLMANSGKRTYQNAEQANKGLYQDTIIPEAESMYDQWNEFFMTENNQVDIQKDFSHIAVLQQDKVNVGRARYYDNQGLLIMWQQNLITANQWLEMAGMDTLPGTEGDVFYSDWVAAGKQFGTATVTATAPKPTAEPPNSASN